MAAVFAESRHAGQLSKQFICRHLGDLCDRLMPFAVIDQYNLIGQTVIIFLMGIGGLGLMSLLALFLTLMRRKLNFF